MEKFKYIIMGKWEYYTEKRYGILILKDLNKHFGNEGWELCGITSVDCYPNGTEHTYYFKRPLRE